MKKRLSDLARFALAAAIAGSWGLGLCGCGDGQSPSAGLHERSNAAPPQRIVCGSPAVAEIVFALGCGDRVVGVSDYTVYPPEAKKTMSIGGWINPNRERLLVMQPDIILAQGQHATLAAFAAEYGIRFHSVDLDALEDLYVAVQTIAEKLDVTTRGEALSAEIRHTLANVSAKVANAPPKRVLLLFGRTPGTLAGLGTVGSGTFLDDIIRIAGGTNIFADAAGTYPQVSKETLLVREPEVILEINPGVVMDQRTLALFRADWQAFRELPAVKQNHIYYLTNDFLLIPGPRVGQIATEFAKAIAAEAFCE